MRVDDALRQIEAIHDRLDQSESYRGFQVWTVALAGVLGLLAGFAQELLVDDSRLIPYWVAVAGVCGVLSGGSAIRSLFRREDADGRRKTFRLLCQFLPCIVAGVVVTAVFARAELPAYLPGLWSILFGQGLLACRPYLPRSIGWVCLWYLAAGCVQLDLAARSGLQPGWQIGVVFGVGHLASALVLSRNVERDHG
jgi:uncharacterized membrane protein HdeD (DUF308 family)